MTDAPWEARLEAEQMFKKLIALSLVSATFVAVPAAADSGTYECTADAGAPFFYAGIMGVDVGGCGLTTVESDSTLTSADPADGCDIHFNTDGDAVSDGTVEEDTTYPSGTKFTANCYTGTFQAQNSITLEDAA